MILLGGGGDAEKSKDLDNKFKTMLRGQKRVLYIPTALRGSDLYDGCYDWFTSIFSAEDFDIDMWKRLDDKDPEGVHEYDAVYIGVVTRTC